MLLDVLRRNQCTTITAIALLFIFITVPYHSYLTNRDDRFLVTLLNRPEPYAYEYHEAPFSGRAFRIPDRIAARVKGYLRPVTPVTQSYDADVVQGPEMRDGRGTESIPRTIYQTWKTNVVGPKMMAAVSSWIEMNPE